MASNEKEIREAFKKILAKRYTEGIIIDEFTGGSMSTRPDIAVVEEERLIFVEIKSDKDYLKRLRSQIQDYQKHSNKVYVVLDIVHHKNYLKLNKEEALNDFWDFELFFYDNGVFLNGMSLVEETFQRRSYYTLSNFYIMNFLWRAEKQLLLSFLKGRSKVKDLDLAIRYVYTAYEITKFSHQLLYQRSKMLEENGRKYVKGYSPGWEDIEINHLDHKQKLFDEYLAIEGSK